MPERKSEREKRETPYFKLLRFFVPVMKVDLVYAFNIMVNNYVFILTDSEAAIFYFFGTLVTTKGGLGQT